MTAGNRVQQHAAYFIRLLTGCPDNDTTRDTRCSLCAVCACQSYSTALKGVWAELKTVPKLVVAIGLLWKHETMDAFQINICNRLSRLYHAEQGLVYVKSLTTTQTLTWKRNQETKGLQDRGRMGTRTPGMAHNARVLQVVTCSAVHLYTE